MNADGSNQTVFAGITQSLPALPAWSPDGSKLAYTSGGEIWTINANGTNAQQITSNATNDTDAAWSPDGSKIIFTTNRDGNN